MFLNCKTWGIQFLKKEIFYTFLIIITFLLTDPGCDRAFVD